MNRRWDFENGTVNKAPEGFTFARTGNGRQGTWGIKKDADAPNANRVLAQIDTDATNYRFPVAVANQPALRDLRLSVKCKPVSGKVDQACGVVFRYRDENNYYVASWTCTNTPTQWITAQMPRGISMLFSKTSIGKR